MLELARLAKYDPLDAAPGCISVNDTTWDSVVNEWARMAPESNQNVSQLVRVNRSALVPEQQAGKQHASYRRPFYDDPRILDSINGDLLHFLLILPRKRKLLLYILFIVVFLIFCLCLLFQVRYCVTNVFSIFT